MRLRSVTTAALIATISATVQLHLPAAGQPTDVDAQLTEELKHAQQLFWTASRDHDAEAHGYRRCALMAARTMTAGRPQLLGTVHLQEGRLYRSERWRHFVLRQSVVFRRCCSIQSLLNVEEGVSRMKHTMVQANGASFHVVQTGHGAPLLLLHGWPEFWLAWEPVMARLADRYRLIAPDLRGFGESDKPDGPFGAQDHAADVLALLDALRIERVGVIGHDVGGAAMQPLARRAPERLVGLFFFDFVYPGIGSRMAAPDRLNEIWYQSFNQMEMAPILVGASQETCRAYISHFLRHWAYRKNAFDEVLSAFVENFLKPGNLAGGFAHYKASHAGRIAMIKGQAPTLPPITVPTCVRWPEHDPLFPYEWTDRLGETFSKLDLAPFPDVGHFPHRENPDRAAAEIAACFDRHSWQ
jgi:pimeloyl-ACP methyl ester carboxylesterase